MRSERFDAEIDMPNHAIQRGYERELTAREIIDAIDHPQARCRLQHNGRFRIESGPVVVIVQKDLHGFRVVTVFFANRRDTYGKKPFP